MSIDVMLDIETVGVKPGCVVLSIGACTFDLRSNFYRKIDPITCREEGLVEEVSTAIWWDKQDPAAKQEAFSGTESIVTVLGAFADWMQILTSEHKEVFIWGNGADFDLPILDAAYNAIFMGKPWKPFNGRCYRTLKNLPRYKDIKADPFEGLKHSAIADAQHQARHAMKILRFDKQI